MDSPPPLSPTLSPGNMPAPPPVATRTSAAAVSSLVAGVGSFFLWILGTIPAVILGIIALRRIGRSGGTLTGRGLAIAGIVTGGAGLFFGIVTMGILAGMIAPIFSKVSEQAAVTKQVTNARQIYLACKLWSLENHGQFPPSLDVLIGDIIDPGSTNILEWRDPSADAPEIEAGEWIYHPGATDSDPIDTVVLESPPFGQSPESVSRIVVRLDGSVEVEEVVPVE